jgi:LacI family transcriptional regulator
MANIKDVARKAGLSVATVSHVLNGTKRTRPQTRQRVLRAVQQVGYTQNQAARNLARGKSNMMALIISDIRNPFFPEITASFQDQALMHDVEALVFNTNYDAQRTLHVVKRLIGLQVPGVAVLTSQIDPAVIDLLANSGTAAVYLDLGRVAPAISNILLGYEHGIAEGLEYLIGLGHRRIGYIGGPTSLHSAQQRKRAFTERAGQMGLEIDRIIDSDFTVQGGYFACSRLLSAGAPTAIIAANDLMAIGVLHRAYDGGLRVPENLSVVGFDDILFAEYTQPALTTVAVPRVEIGKVAFQALWKLVSEASQSGEEFRVNTRLVVRQSTAPPPNAGSN